MKPMIEKIVEISIKILVRGGIDRLTMRAIADELKISATALYRHISNKRQIYYQISEHICQKIKYPQTINDPKEYLIEINSSFRNELLAIKHSASVFGQIIPNSPEHIKFFDKNMEALIAMGIKSPQCFFYVKIINNYIMASVWDEEFFKDILRHKPKGKGVNYYLSHLNNINYEVNFKNGLNAVIDGIIKQYFG